MKPKYIGIFNLYVYILPMDNINETLGESDAYLEMQDEIARLAKIERPVLFIGERGTGKEKAARRLHYMSRRWDGPLVTLNSASLPQNLIEAELFGYEKGAFTGAYQTRKGRFEEADGGTLFLDEIGLIPLSVQEKILRVVEYGTYERIGSSETRSTDVRIIGATNADLRRMCREGKFKEDLLDRLSFEVIFVPPLRRRGNDILLLASYFALKMASECGRTDSPYFSEKVKKELMEYPWPGNIRELKNTVERAVYKAETNEITSLVFDPFRNPYTEERADESDLDFSSYTLKDYRKAKDELDIAFMKHALKDAGNSQKKASELLGLSYDQFRGMYRKYYESLNKDGKKE